MVSFTASEFRRAAVLWRGREACSRQECSAQVEKERGQQRERGRHTDTTAAAELWTSGIGPWPPCSWEVVPAPLCALWPDWEEGHEENREGKVPPALPAATTVNRESPAGRQKCILSVVVGTRWSRGRWFIRSSFFKGQSALRVTFCTCASSKGGLTKINVFIIFRLYL